MNKFIKQVSEVYKPFRFAMLGVFGFIAFSQAISLVAPYLQGKVMDGIINKKPISDVYMLVGLTLVITLFQIVVISFHREIYELKYIDYPIARHTNLITLKKLMKFSIGQHISENSGIKQSIISRGSNALNQLVYMMLYSILPMCIEAVLLIGVLMYFSWRLGVIVLVGVISYVVFVICTNLHFKKELRKMETMHNRNSKFQGEVLRNVSMVLANAQEDRAVRECDESLGKVFNFSQNLWLGFNKFNVFRNVILALIKISVLVVGIWLVYHQKHTVGQLITFLFWSNSALGQITNVGNLHKQLIQMCTSVKRYFNMLAIESDVKVIPNPVRPEKFLGRIEFKNVTLSYKGRDVLEVYDVEDGEDGSEETKEKKEVSPALKNVSFVIEPGQTVAFVGESGAGKSTVAYTLLRSQDPQEGQVIVDGNDLRVLDLKHFRESIGLVDQETPLFDNTLQYNITYGLNGRAAQVTKEALDRISEMSCVSRFFDRLENGYETLIGERGVKLSDGERQRVGIARALAKEPDIMIFDEATSHLDSENEYVIREAIEKVSHGRTTIIIAHRFCTIKNVDKVIVFDRGEVVGQGTHEELAQSCEHYQRLVKNQIF